MTPDANTVTGASATTDTGTSAPNFTEGTDDTANANASQTTNDTKADDNSGKVFTQADVNRIVSRETKKAVEAVLASEAQKKANADLTETQREKAAREAAEKRVLEVEERANKVLIRSAVLAAANDPKLKARDAKVVAALVDASNLEVEGDEVSGVDAEIARIKKAHPALFFGSTADGGAKSSNDAPTTPGLGRLQSAYAETNRS